MTTLNKITLKNFKFFLGENTIEIDSKNLLFYGENGSGKSSIYWALYTFLHSVYKPLDNDIQKYFDPTDDQNIINRFAAAGDESALVVEFVDETHTTTSKTLSYKLINTKAGSLVREAAHASDFVNYRILSRLYDFSNREKIDLFKLFEKEVLMFIDFPMEVSPGVNKASDWWEHLKNGLNPRPNMHTPEYQDFQDRIRGFNAELERYLLSIVQSANEYLQNKFKQKLKINFQYSPTTYDDFEPGSTTRRNHKIIKPKIILTVELENGNNPGNPININRPQSFLNEARLTAIALSVRFAVIDQKYIADATKILVFDDLLVSLDMANRDIVLEIILEEFTGYQKIMLTHDRMFFELAKHKAKKVDPENWFFYEMYESVKDGVTVPFIKKSDSYIDKAKANFEKKEFELAGNLLRKQAEKFAKELLPKRYHFSDEFAPRNLEGLISQCVVYARATGIDQVPFQRLDHHRKFVLNPASHDNIGIAQFTTEIADCIETFDKLDTLQNQVVINKNEQFHLELKGADGIDYKWEILLEDEGMLLKWPGADSQLAPLKFANRMFRGANIIYDWKYSHQTIQAFYEKWFNKSDKIKSNDFWEEIIHTSSGDKLVKFRIF